jgi:CheY-like chemotaxis protein
MKKNPLILLVEDSSDDVDLIRSALRTSGYTNRVEVVGAGDHAIAYLEGAPPYSDRGAYPLPGVIFLDLTLTRLSGFDVLRHMKDAPGMAGIRTVVLTGSPQPADVERAYLLGAHSYLVKPGSFQDLVELLRTSLSLIFGRTTEIKTRGENP